MARHALIDGDERIGAWIELNDPESYAPPAGWRVVSEADAQGLATVPPPRPPVPAEISPGKARLALLQLGLLDDVESVVAAADRATQIMWRHAVAFERAHPAWDVMGAVMGKTAADIDDLFRLASGL